MAKENKAETTTPNVNSEVITPDNVPGDASNAPNSPDNAVDLEKMFAEKMAEMQAAMEAKVAEIEKDAAEKIAEAQAKSINPEPTETDVAKSKTEKDKATEDYLNERVAVKLFKDGDKYSEPVLVSVNGENCLIKRGETVSIKRKFALVLEQSRDQDEYAAQISEAYANDYDAKKDNFVK